MNWTPGQSPVLEQASVPAAIVTPEGNLRVYYVDASGQGAESINCAESKDGGKTFKVLGCVIEGRSGDKAVDPCVVLLPDGRYRLYYYAVKGEINSRELHLICCGVSSDGVNFREENVVFSNPGLVDPDVFWNGREWRMVVFSLDDDKLITAKSADGLSFQYDGPFPIDNWIIVTPVRLPDGRFRDYGFDRPAMQEIRSFLSSDGISWTQEEGVRLAAPEGKSITDPSAVLMPDGAWRMVYKIQRKPAQLPPPR